MNQSPIIEDDALQCPSCQGSNLHHGLTVLAYRDKEDGPGIVTIANKGEVVTRNVSADKMPAGTTWHSRRDAILIDFTCEDCDTSLRLGIKQHKGQTVLRWFEQKSMLEYLLEESPMRPTQLSI